MNFEAFSNFNLSMNAGVRPENLTFKVKFLINFLWKFDLFCQISFAAPMKI